MSIVALVAQNAIILTREKIVTKENLAVIHAAFEKSYLEAKVPNTILESGCFTRVTKILLSLLQYERV